MASLFETTLRQIGDPETPLGFSSLYNLSSPSRLDMAVFAHYWPKIAGERRQRIIRSLVEIAEESFRVDFRAIFRYCLEDPDPQVRADALDGLWEDEDPALIAPLVQLLQDDEAPIVRASAAAALGKYVLQGELNRLSTGQVNFLRNALLGVIRDQREDVEVRRRAVEAIAYAGDEEVRGIIEAAYHDPEPRMQVSAIFAMGRSADRYWVPSVIAELSSLDPERRYEAARASGELQARGAVKHLIRLTQDPDREVQEAAIWALGQIGGAEARGVLEEYCNSDDEFLREAAEDALAELAFIEGTDDLLLYDFDEATEDELEPLEDEDLWEANDEDLWEEDDLVDDEESW